MGRKKQHEWQHMGFDLDTDESYGYCPLCGKYNTDKGGILTIITKTQYEARVNQGKVAFIYGQGNERVVVDVRRA